MMFLDFVSLRASFRDLGIYLQRLFFPLLCLFLPWKEETKANGKMGLFSTILKAEHMMFVDINEMEK